ncbi:MAG: acyltransferase family protein [Clostridia bacterium]|nr:acyltransferase family protein [Clostridia bacterium]
MNNRIGWIDLAKLMGIFLMVLCHGMVPATADNLIHAFHMPLFFVLSGWCFSPEKHTSLWQFCQSRFRTLLFPYFFWSIVIFAGWQLFFLLTNPSKMIYTGDFFYYFLYANASYSPFCAIQWFLTCMFFTQIIGWLVLKGTKARFLPTLLATLAMGMIGWGVSFLPFRLPLSLDVAFCATFFYLSGWLFSRMVQMKFLTHPGILIVMLGLGGFLAYQNGNVNMRLIRLHNPLLFYTAALLLSLGIMGISYHVGKTKVHRIFLWLGQNTLPILLLNQVFIQIIKLLIPTQNPWIWVFLSLGIMGLMVPVIYLLNRFIPTSVGKKDCHCNL